MYGSSEANVPKILMQPCQQVALLVLHQIQQQPGYHRRLGQIIHGLLNQFQIYHFGSPICHLN